MINNYRVRMARELAENNKLKKMGYFVPKTSGIYIFARNEQFAYIGQAKDLQRRIIDHIISYNQHIDISLKKRGLFNQDNAKGWLLTWEECSSDELDSKEREYIAEWLDKGATLYNITSGGQDAGKTDINQRKPSKTYKQGVEYGREQERAKMRQFFEKYLDVTIKGTPNKIKEKKLQEFLEMMKDV